MNALDTIAAELKKLRSALICAHVSPDADAVGSSCGLQRGLASLGIDAVVYLFDAVPQRMLSLVDGVPIVHEVPARRFDGLIVVDTATRARTGSAVDALFSCADKTFNIDHHESNNGWAMFNYIAPHMAAAAVIVEELLRKMQARLDESTANLLFAGLLEDTGSFHFSNVNTDSFTCAVSLMKAGASAEKVANSLYYSLPLRMLALQGKALATVQLVLGGRVALMHVTQQDLAEVQALPEDTEGLVDIVRSVQGTLGAIFLRELPDGGWKVSLRSKVPALDVNKIAAAFGGGGHKAAAGCTIRSGLAEVHRQIVAAFEKALV